MATSPTTKKPTTQKTTKKPNSTASSSTAVKKPAGPANVTTTVGQKQNQGKTASVKKKLEQSPNKTLQESITRAKNSVTGAIEDLETMYDILDQHSAGLITKVEAVDKVVHLKQKVFDLVTAAQHQLIS
jgi:hypothetical protein